MDEHRHVSLNLNVRGIGLSATLAIRERVTELRRQDRLVYDFGLGQSPFPVPDPVVEALREAAAEKDYLPVRGLPALREAVAEFHRRKDKIGVHAGGVLIGPGSKELMFLLQLCYYGDIILPTPCWVSYMPQARIIGRRISYIRTNAADGWKLSAERLEQTLARTNDRTRPRLLVLNYPSNPTGQTYTGKELSAIADVARAYHLILLSDEIYGQLHYKGRHISIARYYPQGTIVSSGLSKWCGAGGWRLGTFAFPPDLTWLMDAMAAAASETYTSVSAPIQYAAISAFRGGDEIERYLFHARRVLSGLADRSVSILADAGVSVMKPAGAFYLFLDFSSLSERLAKRGITDSRILCERLLEETGVAVLPGAFFGRPLTELTARLSFVDFDGRQAIATSELVSPDHEIPPEILNRCCAHLVDGMSRLGEWAAQSSEHTMAAIA